MGSSSSISKPFSSDPAFLLFSPSFFPCFKSILFDFFALLAMKNNLFKALFCLMLSAQWLTRNFSFYYLHSYTQVAPSFCHIRWSMCSFNSIMWFCQRWDASSARWAPKRYISILGMIIPDSLLINKRKYVGYLKVCWCLWYSGWHDLKYFLLVVI